MGKRFIVFAAITFVFFTPGSVSPANDKPANASNPGSFDYDPTECSPPVTDGKIRISLGARVMAWPSDRITFNSPGNPERIPDAPNPNAPEGCPENPVRGGNYALMVEFPREGNDASGKEPKRVLGRAELISTPHGDDGTQDSKIISFDRRCARDRISEIIDDLFIACRVSRSTDMLVRGVSYKALPDVYKAPNQLPFIIDCLSGPESPHPICGIYYKLHTDVNIGYKVVIRSKRQSDAMTLLDVINFDRAFRAAIEAAWIRDYSWAPR